MDLGPGALAPGREAPLIDLAPGRQIACHSCGNARPHGSVGIRLFAASIGKRTLAWCTNCRRLHWAHFDWVR